MNYCSLEQRKFCLDWCLKIVANLFFIFDFVDCLSPESARHELCWIFPWNQHPLRSWVLLKTLSIQIYLKLSPENLVCYFLSDYVSFLNLSLVKSNSGYVSSEKISHYLPDCHILNGNAKAKWFLLKLHFHCFLLIPYFL